MKLQLDDDLGAIAEDYVGKYYRGQPDRRDRYRSGLEKFLQAEVDAKAKELGGATIQYLDIVRHRVEAS